MYQGSLRLFIFCDHRLTSFLLQDHPHMERRIDTLFDGVKSRFSRQ